MKQQESRINAFLESLDANSEMTEKQFVTLSGAGDIDDPTTDPSEGEKNKHNTLCCN